MFGVDFSGAGAGGYRFERIHCGSSGFTPVVAHLGSCDAQPAGHRLFSTLAALRSGRSLLWLACLSVTFMVAVFFVATPNAIAYEELLLVPVLFFPGFSSRPLKRPPGWMPRVCSFPTGAGSPAT